MEEAFDQPPDYSGVNMAYKQFESRVLQPLESFGLIEQRELKGPNLFLPRHEYRVGSLFDRFVRFDVE